MSVTVFLMLLSAFSIISSLITECVKKLVTDKANLSYNIIALVVAIIVGSCGCGIYYQLNAIAYNTNNIIYMILMGFASGLCSMVSYDKVKQAIEQVVDKSQPK